jgi:hypothetical protein
MRGWITSPRSNLLSNTSWRIFLHSPYCDVYFSRDWTRRKVALIGPSFCVLTERATILVDEDDLDAANRRIKAARKEVLPFRQVISDSMRKLFALQADFLQALK